MTPSSVRVRLKQDVKGLGRAGQLAEVNFGYARNFLISQGLAEIVVGRRTAEQLSKQRTQQAIKPADHSPVQMIADSLAGRSITITAAANSDGKLFAGIQADQIAKALETDPLFRMEPIKHTGTHQVVLDFGHDIIATVSATVKPQLIARRS